jgi:hypothetical protein
VINTIGMSETNALKKLLQDLAKITGGQSVFVGE